MQFRCVCFRSKGPPVKSYDQSSFLPDIPIVITLGTCHCCHRLGSRGSSRPWLTRYRTLGLLWAPLATTELIQICKMRLLKFFCSCNFCTSASTSELLQFYTKPRLNWPTPKNVTLLSKKVTCLLGAPHLKMIQMFSVVFASKSVFPGVIVWTNQDST